MVEVGSENDQTGLTILSNSPAVSCFSPYLIIVIIIMSIITTTDIGQNKHVQADQYVRLVENVNNLKDILKCLSWRNLEVDRVPEDAIIQLIFLFC